MISSQDELLAVAREHKRRGLPMDAIVIDFFHWTRQGDFKFEPRDWPDPDAMVKELKEMGIETVVSVWPTIDERSENFGTMSEMGYLVNADRGNQNHMTWSGDIHSSFRSMREQLQAGLNMGMAGIPWWTSDIGGFLGGDISDKSFQELLVRWFEWGAFCPVFRMHGERSPWYYKRKEEFINGVRQLTSGQDNEVWSFGEENYKILSKYLFIRERLRPYIRECMKAASETGAPVMRPLFFDFPEDPVCWETEDCYMFGPDLLVAPVMEEGARTRTVYLPAGTRWKDAYTGKTYEGGQTVETEAPLDIIPVMMREGCSYEIY